MRRCEICNHMHKTKTRLCSPCGEMIQRLLTVEKRLQMQDDKYKELFSKSVGVEAVATAPPPEEHVMAEAVEVPAEFFEEVTNGRWRNFTNGFNVRSFKRRLR